jgi:hypothetical protein
MGPHAAPSKAYALSLIVLLGNSTLRDVEAKEDVSQDVLLGILARQAG